METTKKDGAKTNGFAVQFLLFFFTAVSVQFTAGQFLARKLLNTSVFQKAQLNGHLVLQFSFLA